MVKIKRCTKCREEKRFAEFYKHKNEPLGLQEWCKECRKKSDKERYDSQDRAHMVEREWKGSIRRRYKLSPEDYENLLTKQNGVCAVCEHEEKTHRKLCVDHDHACCPTENSCGKCVRGLLCSRCNRGLGLLNDDPKLLRKALEYIENDDT